MPDFMLQQNPEVSPRTCYFCGAFEGPFVNTMTFDPTGRIILICAPKDDESRLTGCAGGIVQTIGGLTPAGARKLKEQRDEATGRQAELEQRIEQFRSNLSESFAETLG